MSGWVFQTPKGVNLSDYVAHDSLQTLQSWRKLTNDFYLLKSVERISDSTEWTINIDNNKWKKKN